MPLSHNAPRLPCHVILTERSPSLLSGMPGLQTRTSKALQRSYVSWQCVWHRISNPCNVCKALKMPNFLFQSEKEKFIPSGLETSLSELTLSREKRLRSVSVLCYTPGYSCCGGWSSRLSGTQVGRIACVSTTEKFSPLQSVPRAMSSRSVCSNSLYIAALPNTCLEKISGRRPRGVRKVKYRVRRLHWGPECTQDSITLLTWSVNWIPCS